MVNFKVQYLSEFVYRDSECSINLKFKIGYFPK